MSVRARLGAWMIICLSSLGWSAGCSSGADGDVGSSDEEIIHGGEHCSTDTDCNHGVDGLGVICYRSGSSANTCGDGCHSDTDCPGGGSCDKSTSHWACNDPFPRLGTPCVDDAFCTGKDTEGYDDTENLGGMGRVCSRRSHRCIVGCYADDDCPSGTYCDTKRTSMCIPNGADPGDNPGTDDTSDTSPPDSTGCSPITYPSGVTLVTKPDDATTAKYRALGAKNCAVPKCFIDLSDLRSPDGATYDVDVALSEHFSLREIVGTEIQGSWSMFVLVDPRFVNVLEETRVRAGEPLALSSGFRSPDHQRATCMSLCGCAQCVSNGRGGNRCSNGGGRVTCAKNSRHMWGAAADMSLAYSRDAREAGFPFVFNEYGGTGPHLHVDMKACR